jgi:hypothetical protein
MNLQIFKNKFVVALPVSLVILACLYKFNEYKILDSKKTEEEKKTENEKLNMIYYMKSFLLCYIVSLVLVILLKKGYIYYIENIKSKSSNNITNPSSQSVSTSSIQQSSVIDNSIITENTVTDLNDNNTNNTNTNNTNTNNKLENLELNLDTDTTSLEEITLPKVNKEVEKLKKKKALLAKRKKLLEFKKQNDLVNSKNNNNLQLETFNTGNPDF